MTTASAGSEPRRSLSAARRFWAAAAWLLLLTISLILIARQAVHAGRNVLPADGPVLNFLAGHRTSPVTAAARVMSTVASPVGLVITVVVVVALIWWRRRRTVDVLLTLVTVVGVGLVDQLVKFTVARPRPPLALAVKNVSALGFSFPSGHTIQSTAVYGLLAILLLRGAERRSRLVIGLVAGLLVVAVGLSRMYLGVHWLSDVLAGALLGGSWLLVAVYGAAVIEKRYPRVAALSR